MKKNLILKTENEILVYAIFQKIGINFRLKRSKYLFRAMLIYIEKPNLRFANAICPMIAEEFSIDSKSVRTMLCSEIKQAWKTCPLEVIKELTDYPLFTGKEKIPTNGEFFFMVRRWVLKNKKT